MYPNQGWIQEFTKGGTNLLIPLGQSLKLSGSNVQSLDGARRGKGFLRKNLNWALCNGISWYLAIRISIVQLLWNHLKKNVIEKKKEKRGWGLKPENLGFGSLSQLTVSTGWKNLQRIMGKVSLLFEQV